MERGRLARELKHADKLSALLEDRPQPPANFVVSHNFR